MSFKEIEIRRIYSCQKCKGEIGIKQGVSDSFLKECPFCLESALVIKSARAGMYFGGLSDKQEMADMAQQELKTHTNSKKVKWREKYGRKIPWWRSGKNEKVDYSILKNPEHYIETGEKT